MSSVFISSAEQAYEFTQIIGVFDNLDDAVQRCKDRPYPGQDAHEFGTYDRWWVEEWETGGDFVNQYDLINGEAVAQKVDEVG